MYAYTPYTPASALANHTFDVGVLIALPEELDYFLETIFAPDLKYFEAADLHSFWEGEVNFKKFDLRIKENDEFVGVTQVVVAMVNEMGNEYTAMATKIMVDTWHLPFIVNIGLTGSLDKDLKIGSVLVPTQITQYTSNWKATDSSAASSESVPEFVFGTRAFATSRLISSQFSSFQCSKEYRKWQDDCQLRGQKPSMFTGHLASGNMVIDSESFKKKLKATDRKLMGCEMEAAGFAIAEQFLETASRAFSQFICLRCISDMAANKQSVEEEIPMDSQESADIIPPRKWAMANATKLFLVLLKYRVIDTNVDAQINRIEHITRELKDRKQAAAKRPLQSDSTSIAAILNSTNTQKSVKELPEHTQQRLCDHFGITGNNQKALIEKMKDGGYFNKSTPKSIDRRKRTRTLESEITAEGDATTNSDVTETQRMDDESVYTYQDVINELYSSVEKLAKNPQIEVPEALFLDFKDKLAAALSVLRSPNL